MSDGNKTNNGVHEVGTEETRLAYQNDTPGQHVERYLNTINEVIEEKKEKQKKTFTKVFDNPLKGFPYNEELDDNFVASLEEDDKRDGDPCWKGYKQVGMKKKGGKEVPNCVPMNEEELEKAGIKKEDVDYSHVEDLEEVSNSEIGAMKKLSKDMQAVLKGYQKIMGMGDKELKDKKYNKNYEAILDARNKVLTLIGTLTTKQQLESVDLDLEEGKMGELFLDIQNGATAKDIARDYPVSIQQAKDFLKDYYSQKKKPLKMGEETEILRNYDSLLEAKDLMPDIKKIVDTKSATKVGGVMLDMFTASMILTVYDKVNDQNKGRMEKSNIQTLVHIAHKVMGVKEETVSEGKKIQDIVRKHKRELQKVQKSGNLELSKKAEDELSNWASSNGEIRGDDEDEFIEWLDNNLDNLIKGKIKEAKVECPECHGQDGGCDHCDGKGYHMTEKFRPYTDKTYSRCVDFYIQFRGGQPDENKKDFSKAKDMIDAYCKKNKIKQKPVYSTPEEGSSAYKVGLMIDPSYSKTDDYKRGIDLQPLYVSLSKLKTSEDHGGGWDKIVKGPLPKLEMKEGSMDGSKLTGQEISVYFRRHKVRDKMTRKAVEYALDHGGAMKYAIKGIEKMKKGLSKNKDVQKALNYANYGTEQKVPEVGFMFKENSPIAGNMQVEGDPYIPQKKGVNKNIANYWKKEIKGISQKELEAVQSMYMITDHSGVIQMYKAGKRAFIKSLK